MTVGDVTAPLLETLTFGARVDLGGDDCEQAFQILEPRRGIGVGPAPEPLGWLPLGLVLCCLYVRGSFRRSGSARELHGEPVQ